MRALRPRRRAEAAMTETEDTDTADADPGVTEHEGVGPTIALTWNISGRVQGVGFRPFVYRLAHRHGLDGWVCNGAGGVTVHAQGSRGALSAFGAALTESGPPAARIDQLRMRAAAVESCRGFAIRNSRTGGPVEAHLPTDLDACGECIAEMHDPAARRFRYPFINCTQCGPRYTLIQSLPYDRANTTMSGFAMCAACAREYADPLDRRFHAQPLACARCGPALQWQTAGVVTKGNEAALAAAVAALRAGRIVALRGVGGYHLLCDATQSEAIERLRLRKHRPAKPLAVVVPWAGADGLALARRLARLEPAHEAALLDPVRPLVLAPRREDAGLGAGIAPGLDEIALMLPYSPLLHLLLGDLGRPIIATSANVSGEAVLTQAEEVNQRLGDIADDYLHHDRDIARPAEDPVFRMIAGSMRPLRHGRGTAPVELTLPFAMRTPTLAVGAYGKNTIALAWGRRAVVSPHIGDLGSLRSQTVFAQVAADLQDLYGVRAQQVIHDAHPGYPNTRWARALGLPAHAVWHHAAHASAVAGEFASSRDLLCFSWDGTGLGPDGTLWGGEALLGSPGRWQRVASFRPFRLPGGDRAAREPWRAALALCWESSTDWVGATGSIARGADLATLRRARDRGLNTPVSSAVGRLFDAAAALLGVCAQVTYEGEAAMRVEALARDAGSAGQDRALPLARNAQGLWCADWQDLLPDLLDSRRAVAQRAGVFHARLAQTLYAQALRIREETAVNQVGLCGGVFQNALLAGRARSLLESAGFDVLLPLRLPVNDAAISYGQLVEAAAPAFAGANPG